MFNLGSFRNPDTLPGAWPGLNTTAVSVPQVVAASAGDSTSLAPRTDGGSVGSSVTNGSVSNTPAQGVGASTNFSLAGLGSTVSDVIANPSQHYLALAIFALVVYFAWKHFK